MKKLIYILALLSLSCSKEESITVSIKSAFTWNDTCGNHERIGCMELDIDGKTYTLVPEYVEIGLRAELDLPMGEKTVTRAEVFDFEGKRIYYQSNWEERTEADVVSIPYDFDEVLVLQWRCDG